MFFTGFSVKIHKFFKTFFFYSQHVILENTIRVPLLKHAIWIQVKIWGEIGTKMYWEIGYLHPFAVFHHRAEDHHANEGDYSMDNEELLFVLYIALYYYNI